ncbi:MAG TPA: UDP-2,3-diacylglucosamine diphosphatase LpxI [Pirellulaceae bacterium]|jgi:hypothetical protein|nr:UDP-2,3-diacylglucosamine diphosphatase LpxI [Pirellulaceae bacterium]
MSLTAVLSTNASLSAAHRIAAAELRDSDLPGPGDRVGLIAGWGRFPIVVAQALKARGCEVYCVGIFGHCDAELRNLCDDYVEMGPAKLGGHIRWFRNRGVSCATMAGKLFKTQIFKHRHWLFHLPDWETIRSFYPHFVLKSRDLKDDTILLTVIDTFARKQIRFEPAVRFAPELLVKYGCLTRKGLNDAQRRDVEFGWTVAKALGGHDIGQSVAVRHGTILAVEAVEGTDACIRRAGELCKMGGFSLVKTAKPQQDMRFDVPTVGLGTIETLRAAGGKALAVEADRTIFLDYEETIAFAERHGIAIVAVEEGEGSLSIPAAGSAKSAEEGDGSRESAA